MRPKLPRLLHLLRAKPQNRFFAHLHHPHLQRPQLPFLNPSSLRRPATQAQIRWLSTERKGWIISEVKNGVKYTAVIWTFGALLFVIAFGVQQEYFERTFHSPHEWSFNTRRNYRSAKFGDTLGLVNWARQGDTYRKLIKRLETAGIDGDGVVEIIEGGVLVDGVGHTGYDVSAKSEPWRRGYYDCIMGAARAAEHLDGWVRDKTQNLAFPANTVIGPSNPDVKPLPPGSPPAPREENCERGFEPPEVYYMKILTTKGFTKKQRMDAALAYASWLDFKNTPDTAREMYRWALDIVTETQIFDKLGKLNPEIPISSNLLAATTAMATHQATTGNLKMALPLYLSVLKARRSLPSAPPRAKNAPEEVSEISKFKQAFSLVNGFIFSAFTVPAYPPAPPDGTELPMRDDRSICEEAGLMAYIGEILYATSTTQSGKEDGLAWTREAVDTAEEVIRSLAATEKETSSVCKQCLETGFSNWRTMVSTLAVQEKAAREKRREQKSNSWFGSGEVQDGPGRWESEEAVVKERMTRAPSGALGNTVNGGQSSAFFL